MFKNFNANRLSRSQQAMRPIANSDDTLLADIMNARDNLVTSHDDNFNGTFGQEKKTGEFGDNQFWKTPDMYDIDELLAEQEKGA